MATGSDLARLDTLIDELEDNLQADETAGELTDEARQFWVAQVDAAIQKLDQLRQRLQPT